jgi:hypothetical protein
MSAMRQTERCSPTKPWTVALAGLAAGLLLPLSASAQTSYPMLMSLKPVAVQVGTTAECTVNARYNLLDSGPVFVSGSGVTAEVIPPEMPELKPGETRKEVTSLKLKITATAEAETGPREFRIATPRGVSTIGQVVVVRDPVLAEAAENDLRDNAQPVTLPAVLCGTIEKGEDFDWYKFNVEAGQTVAFHVLGQRLEDKIHDLQVHLDPILFLRDAQGGVVAMSDNAHFADPFLVHTFASAGEFYLEIRDVRFQGNADWVYAVEVHSRPVITQVFPVAMSPGTATAVELSGWNLPQPATATITAAGPPGWQRVRVPYGDQWSDPVPVLVTELPQFVEPASAENDTIAQALEVTSPVVISGRMEKPSDLDVYRFSAKQGEVFSFEIRARRHQSQLDSFLRILNDQGGVTREDDDCRDGRLQHADTWIEGWTAPADGNYFVEVRDVHLRGGDGYGYVLTIQPTKPTFELIVDTDKTQLTPGTHGAIYVRATRKHGFTGEIQLHIDGLPAGVTAACGKIIKNQYQDGMIVLSADPSATLAAANVRIWGTSVIPQGEGQPPLEMTVDAVPYQETYNPGGGRVHWPVSSHCVNVGQPLDLLAVNLSETELKLKPGETRTIKVSLQRAPEMKANVLLEMVYQHLGGIHGNSMPDGIEIDGTASQTLLTNGASEGTMVIKVDPKAAPVERQLTSVMANLSINFVMKATYSSPPVYITIEPATTP